MKNVVIFTVHKAGSMFVHRLTDYMTHQIHMPYYSPNKGNLPDVPRLLADTSYFNNKIGCFGPLRQYYPIEDIDDYNVILHLRDPRDVLVSLFFMVTHKNPGPRRWIRNVIRAYPFPAIWQVSPGELLNLGILQVKRLGHIKRYRQMRAATGGLIESGIDQYVMKRAEEYYLRYATYCEKLLGKDNVTLLRYEDMVLDFDHWISEFAKAFGADAETAISESMKKGLREKFQMRAEDRKSHKRKVTPGDHRDKLMPETIHALNERFSDILDVLGYPK